jgi:VWFA-related protein
MRVPFALAALTMAGVMLSAQAPAPAVSAAPPPQTASEQPTFRGGVTLVTTDVIPRDESGRFVSDLSKDDFTITEDGQPQTLASFVLVNGGRVFNLLQPAPVTASSSEGIVLPPQRRSADMGSGRVLLVFVDDLHFEVNYTPHVRRIVQQLAETLMHDGDLVGMVSSGPSAIEISPTLDRKLIAASVTKIRGSAMTPAEMFQFLETSQGPGDLRYRAQVAFQTMYSMVDSLDQVQNRRKAIVYIGSGYDFDPYAEARNSRDRIQGGRFADPTRFLIDQENPYFRMGTITADVDLYGYLRELTLSANRTNTSIFTVDPRGLAGVTDAGQYLDQSEVRTFLNKTISSLRYIAEETGGFAVVNDNDFETAFKRIDAETSDYYVLGYYSTNPDPKQRVRAVDIKVTRPNVNVAARKAYSLKSTEPLPPPLPQPKEPAKKKK